LVHNEIKKRILFFRKRWHSISQT